MAYETKVLLRAIAEIVKANENQEDIYNALARLANVEGVILEPAELKKALMAAETKIILKTLLLQAKEAKSLDDIIFAIEVMCDEEAVAWVEKKINEKREKKGKD